MRTTLMLDDDIHEVAKSIAAKTGEPLGKVVSRLIRDGLKPPRRVDRIRDDQLPSFSVSDGAAIIPCDRASMLLDEED